MVSSLALYTLFATPIVSQCHHLVSLSACAWIIVLFFRLFSFSVGVCFLSFGLFFGCCSRRYSMMQGVKRVVSWASIISAHLHSPFSINCLYSPLYFHFLIALLSFIRPLTLYYPCYSKAYPEIRKIYSLAWYIWFGIIYIRGGSMLCAMCTVDTVRQFLCTLFLSIRKRSL